MMSVSKRRPDVFVGVTSWNSALFLPHCIRALKDCTRNATIDIVVHDNCSEDGSDRIAQECGARVVREACSQADALNRLAKLSDAPLTLLIHADVVLLSPKWLEICGTELTGNVALVSPEDIGCGPLTRPFGAGKPESSFMLFRTEALTRMRQVRWQRFGRFQIMRPRRVVDFYGQHVTHNLPERLAGLKLDWKPMTVLWSKNTIQPIYTPKEPPDVWSEKLAHLRYGLGNFYSLGGTITHYHNWYDRIARQVDIDPDSESVRRRSGFPPGYIRACTTAFLKDLEAGELDLPSPTREYQQPVAL